MHLVLCGIAYKVLRNENHFINERRKRLRLSDDILPLLDVTLLTVTQSHKK